MLPLLRLLLLLSCFSCVRLCATHRWQPTRLPRPWDSPGKNTGVGCHFLLQCTKVKSESEIAQSCPTLSDRMDCSLPGSSVHGIFQAGSEVPLPSPLFVWLGSIPGSGRSSGEGNGYPLQYPSLENFMNRGAWWFTVHGAAKSR